MEKIAWRGEVAESIGHTYQTARTIIVMIVGARKTVTWLALLAPLLSPVSPLAEGLYKWVDKDGKVHYSSTAPSEAPRAETRLSLPSAPATAAGPVSPSGRDGAGNCQTVKCMADQLEADRLARERGYAARRAENENEVFKDRETSRRKKAKERAEDAERQWQRRYRVR